MQEIDFFPDTPCYTVNTDLIRTLVSYRLIFDMKSYLFKNRSYQHLEKGTVRNVSTMHLKNKTKQNTHTHSHPPTPPHTKNISYQLQNRTARTYLYAHNVDRNCQFDKCRYITAVFQEERGSLSYIYPRFDMGLINTDQWPLQQQYEDILANYSLSYTWLF